MKTESVSSEAAAGKRPPDPHDTKRLTAHRRGETRKDQLSRLSKKTRSRAAIIYGLTTIIPLLVMVYIIQTQLNGGKKIGLAWISCLGLIAMTIGLLGGKLMKETWSKIGDALEAVDRLRKTTALPPGASQQKPVDEIDRIPAVVNQLVDIARKQRDKLKDHSEQLRTLNLKVKESDEQLHKMSREDLLTGLFNRRHFAEVVQKEIERARRYGRDLALAMIQPGSPQGPAIPDRNHGDDEVLIATATIIRGAIRQIDLPFRYGSQRFAILFPETSVEKARVALERIRSAVARHCIKGNTPPANGNLTISIGVSMLRKDHKGDTDFVSSADEALYEAMSRGQNQLVAQSPAHAALQA